MTMFVLSTASTRTKLVATDLGRISPQLNPFSLLAPHHLITRILGLQIIGHCGLLLLYERLVGRNLAEEAIHDISIDIIAHIGEHLK